MRLGIETCPNSRIYCLATGLSAHWRIIITTSWMITVCRNVLRRYMAAAKPVVTTDMPECRKYPGVFVAQILREFIDLLEHAFPLVNNPVYLQQLYQAAKANTWKARIRFAGNAHKSG